MALQQTLTTESGVVVNNAYIKVTSVFISPKNKMQIWVSAFVDPQQSVSFADEVVKAQYDHTQSNPLQQAYTHLKTLEKYKFAEDC